MIRLAPLIDVVFILLVFFMLASSFLDWRAFELDVPATAPASDAEQRPILIEVAADGGLRVEGEAVAAADLAEAVGALRASGDAERPIVIRAHGDAPVAATVRAFDRLQAGGIHAVSLAGERP